MMSIYSERPEEGGDVLRKLIACFHLSHLRSTEEHRRLEEHIAELQLEVERKNLTLEQSRYEREAEAARSRRLASLGEMAVGITHEMRNPLGGIELYASLIADQHEGEVKRLASGILQAVHRLQTMISHLLSFAAEPRITAEVLPVPTLLHEVREAVVPLLHQGKWSLATEVEGDLPPLWGDRILLTQALANLIVNAAEAMPQGGAVRLQAQQTSPSATDHLQRKVQIRVEDEGVGIPPEDRERIFAPFFTTKLTGTGLGLALTHKIICAHSGSIEVSPAPVRGSRLTVFLPTADEVGTTHALVASSVDSVRQRSKGRKHEETNCYS